MVSCSHNHVPWPELDSGFPAGIEAAALCKEPWEWTLKAQVPALALPLTVGPQAWSLSHASVSFRQPLRSSSGF